MPERRANNSSGTARGWLKKPTSAAARAAAALPLPGVAAVAGGKDSPQRADGPAVLRVDKRQAHQRQALSGGECMPGVSAIGRVQDARPQASRRSRLRFHERPAHANRIVRPIPRAARPAGDCHVRPKSPVDSTSPPSPTSQPASGATSFTRRSPRRPSGGARDSSNPRRRTVANAPRRPTSAPESGSIKSPPNQVESAAPASGVQVRPPLSVANTPEGNSAMPSPIAHPCAGEEFDLFQPRQRDGPVERPASPAVAGHQQHATGGRQKRRVGGAGGPAVVGIQKMDRFQPAVDSGGLPLPAAAAIGGVPDDAPIADGPAALRIDEADVGQFSVFRRWRGQLLGRRLGVDGSPRPSRAAIGIAKKCRQVVRDHA